MILYNRLGQSLGNAVEVDESLSVTGAVAEAKAVGDRIAEVAEDGSVENWLTRSAYNLISKEKLTVGTLNTSTGAVTGTSGFTSDFVDVTEGTSYALRNTSYLCTYDSSKAFASYVGNNVNVWTCPAGVSYIRVSMTDANKDLSRAVILALFGQPEVKGHIYTGATGATSIALHKAMSALAEDDTSFFVKTDNLFDYEHDWVQYSQGQKGVNTSTGEFVFNTVADANGEFRADAPISPIKFFSVTEGQTITANIQFKDGAYYDENKLYLGSMGAFNNGQQFPPNSWTAPAGCHYVRINFYGVADEETVKNLTVTVRSYDVRSNRGEKMDAPLPAYQIDGKLLSANYLDQVIPNMVESRFVSAMRCLAIREANGREHAFRLGNFNMYVGNKTRGWDITKKMLMDYGCDFCGFEEVDNNDVDLASFLKSWQFPYGFYAGTEAEKNVDKAFVSRFPISSITFPEFTHDDSPYPIPNIKVTLPRLLDVYKPQRVLSVYIVHLPITTADKKRNVANQLLSIIDQDTSDYVVVFGDMNDMGTTEETKTYWRTLESGGLRPVLPIESKTVTQDILDVVSGDENLKWREKALDQFCVSSNIEVKRYGVVNTKDGYGDSHVMTYEDSPCLSDHDFVWCDIVFKDEARQ